MQNNFRSLLQIEVFTKKELVYVTKKNSYTSLSMQNGQGYITKKNLRKDIWSLESETKGTLVMPVRRPHEADERHVMFL